MTSKKHPQHPPEVQVRSPIRVLIVDPSPDMVRTITTFLDSTSDMQVVGSAATTEEAFARTEELHPDVVMMEVTLPGRYDGLQVAQAITRRWQTCVVMMSEHREAEYLMRAMKIGARGYLTKPFTADEFAETVRSAHVSMRMERIVP